MAVIETAGLTKEYSRGIRPFDAVCDVSLSVGEKDFISIMGRSGSGKSTLLNLIAGILRPTSGSVSVKGKDISILSDRESSLIRNSEMGYVSQGHSLLGNLTVLENVMLPHTLFRANTTDANDHAMSLLESVGISELADHLPRSLSGGEQRRAAIARALMNSPSVLIADEPTSDLDSETSQQVMEQFQRINDSGTAILMVTHESDTADFGNRHFIMDAGRLTETPHEHRK
ncbi:MAG: ABC transporter ATP-binding protein [Candidatus Methanoplasma sp.]|jgi:putative ABC transport system ATP-binding protein|nr:ABC transporter ATP-binding protein [Candidatus Methanoplasma sp.]